MQKRRKLSIKKISIAFVIFVVLVILGSFLTYKLNLRSVSSKSNEISFVVSNGSTYQSIASSLKKNKLIRSELFYKIYIKLNSPSNLQVGEYKLNQNMSVSQIIDVLEGGSNYNPDTVKITFKEGITFRDVAKLISSSFNISEDDIYNKIKDETYLNSLIKNYWFLTDSIKNKKIYYSLEGYLFPDTYEFNSKDSLESIFKKMLDNTNTKLANYKSAIESSKYNVHEIITMASIIEKESSGSTSDILDNTNYNVYQAVSGVFYNRLNSGWSLGSDVTTYYGLKLDLHERDLTSNELAQVNAYNTRSSSMAGKLPVGPICMPSIEAINASINPMKHKYYYFVADKNGKTYFNQNATGHSNTISKLKREGKWYEY